MKNEKTHHKKGSMCITCSHTGICEAYKRFVFVNFCNGLPEIKKTHEKSTSRSK